jgi:hypothetical protein
MFFPVFLLITFVVFNQANAGRVLIPSLNENNCALEHGNRLLNEGEKLMVNGKLYKVEDCHLQRAYQTCGTHLWFMINIVCGAIDVQKQKTKYDNRVRRFAQETLLTDACCDNSCTVAEMTRYCPN